jgi:hypothetical protein
MSSPSRPALGQQDSPGPERRAVPRYPCRLETFCQPGAGKLEDFWWRARVCDISTHGLCLVLGRHFEPGIGLLVELPSVRQNYTTLQTRVVRATPTAKGQWITGCAFAWALSDEEMQVCL